MTRAQVGMNVHYNSELFTLVIPKGNVILLAHLKVLLKNMALLRPVPFSYIMVFEDLYKGGNGLYEGEIMKRVGKLNHIWKEAKNRKVH